MAFHAIYDQVLSLNAKSGLPALPRTLQKVGTGQDKLGQFSACKVKITNFQDP